MTAYRSGSSPDIYDCLATLAHVPIFLTPDDSGSSFDDFYSHRDLAVRAHSRKIELGLWAQVGRPTKIPGTPAAWQVRQEQLKRLREQEEQQRLQQEEEEERRLLLDVQLERRGQRLSSRELAGIGAEGDRLARESLQGGDGEVDSEVDIIDFLQRSDSVSNLDEDDPS
jgi:hypothetical protein